MVPHVNSVTTPLARKLQIQHLAAVLGVCVLLIKRESVDLGIHANSVTMCRRTKMLMGIILIVSSSLVAVVLFAIRAVICSVLGSS